MPVWPGFDDATAQATSPTTFMSANGYAYEMLALFNMTDSVDSENGKILLNENFKQIAETMLSLFKLTIQSKTDDYTTVSADFGTYIRLTAGASKTLTLHSPAAADVGKILRINNVSGNSWTVSTAATINGTLASLADNASVTLVAGATGEWDILA